MRLIHIHIDGYKSLRDASTYVNGRMVAFVGPNEAGKSSVLEALALFGSDEPLASHLRSRSGAPVEDEHAVVRATFVLDQEERESFDGLELVDLPKKLILERRAGDGQPRMFLEPAPRRDPAKRRAARAALEEIERRLAAASEELDSGTPEHANAEAAFGAVVSALASFDERPPTYREVDWPGLLAEVGEVPGAVTDSEQIQAVRTFVSQLERRSPQQECEAVIADRIPPFLLLDQAARDLKTSYNLADPSVLDSTPPALEHLLSLAGTTARQIAGVLSDRSRRETLLEQVNGRLSLIFRRRWGQSDLSVHLNTNGSELEILIHEPLASAKSGLDERSDGLRAFVALTSFVGTDRPVRPILLIDEAENHLHYNAQADLINMLSDRNLAMQVLYTTHSPGCLPRDLGYGVRFVEPDRANRVSRIRHDFWAYEDPDQRAGFSPLLFVMGAGAAAFASLRHAVVGEGPSEMLLLPSLIRSALDVEDLPYQVAPGVSTLAGTGFPALGEIAATICYLTDGDVGGSSLRALLLSQGVPAEHIVSLPAGWAIEDLISRSQYLDAVALLGNLGESLNHLLEAPGPIKGAVRADLERRGLSMPGAVAVAEHLLGSETPVRAHPQAIECLVGLDATFRRIFGLA